MVPQLFFGENKSVVSLFQFKRIEIIFKINRGVNRIRNLAALKEVFVYASSQRHIFRKFLFVQSVQELEERQKITLSRPVGTYQYIDGKQVECQIPKRLISFYFYFVHNLMLLGSDYRKDSNFSLLNYLKFSDS